jgi:hypothetical protein
MLPETPGAAPAGTRPADHLGAGVDCYQRLYGWRWSRPTPAHGRYSHSSTRRPSSSRRSGVYVCSIRAGEHERRRWNWQNSSTGWRSAQPRQHPVGRLTMHSGPSCSSGAKTLQPGRTWNRESPSSTRQRSGPRRSAMARCLGACTFPYSTCSARCTNCYVVIGLLEQHGIASLADLDGSMTAWANAGLEMRGVQLL